MRGRLPSPGDPWEWGRELLPIPTEHRRTHSLSRTSLHLGSCEGLQGGAKEVGGLQKGACWGLSFPAPGYSPLPPAPSRPDSWLLRRVVWNPHPGSGGVSRTPHLLAPGLRRPRLLIPDLAAGTWPPCAESRAPGGAVAPKRAVAGAAPLGCTPPERWPGREGQRGEGSPHRPPRLVSQPRGPEGGGRRSCLLTCHLALPPAPIHAAIRSFIPFAVIQHLRLRPFPERSERTYCVRRPCLGSWRGARCRRIPAPPPAASPS